MPDFTIERWRPPATDAVCRGLAAVLVDAVESGAAVSFILPLTLEQAAEWWQSTLAAPHPRAIFLIAREQSSGGIVGTVQLQPAWAPNQPHRAELCKLLVHRRARGGGLGRALMLAAESAAGQSGFRLLTLDAKRGGAAEHLYQSLGWCRVGEIPRYAVDPDGVTLHDTVVFYKDVEPLPRT